MQLYNVQINLDVLDVNAQKMLRLILPIRNVTLVQTLNGGNSGQRKKTAVVQNLNYHEIQFFSLWEIEKNMIQAVTKIFLTHNEENVYIKYEKIG